MLYRWSPDAVKKGTQISVAESLTALVSKYLDCVLAAQQQEVEEFFSKLTSRARVREAINALQAARELHFVHVDGRVMLQVSELQEQVAHEFTPRAKFEALPPRPGMPLVQRRPRRSSASSRPKPPSKGSVTE